MSKRPEDATDCPGCDTGWTTGDLLCPLCAQAVCVSKPELFDLWLQARARHQEYLDDDDGGPAHFDLTNGQACMEAYYRGFIIGTARVLSAHRAAQHAAWKERKEQRRKRP